MSPSFEALRQQRHPEGVLQRIVYQNPDTGWTVARLVRDDHDGDGITVVGSLAGIPEGASVRLHGRWEEDNRYGAQFRVERFDHLRPTTLQGIERYLASGLFPGIGPGLAARIVAEFGHDTLAMLDEEPHKLHRIAGLGKTRVKALTRTWREQQQVRQALLFLQSHGVSAALAQRIQAHFGNETLQTVQDDPYRLANEVRGIGFHTADEIARATGLPAYAPQRLETGLLFALRTAADNGHCYLPRPVLLQETQRLLRDDAQEPSGLADALERLQQRGRMVVEVEGAETRVYSARLHRHETSAAAHLARLLAASPPSPGDIDRLLQAVSNQTRVPLATEQRQLLSDVARLPLLVLTGGPGTGKTTLVRAVCDLFAAAQQRVVLCAPTGRAAQRLAEATGRDTWTLHRLLEWKPQDGGFLRNEHHLLEGDVFIVDEASMVDLPLLVSLLRALPPAARLLFVGDVDQLPSVGPGCVLEDVIASERVPTRVLTRVFRQQEASPILENAHRIRLGDLPQLPPAGTRGDFVFIERETPEEVQQTLLTLVAERLPQTLGVDPARDIQVLVPMNRGPLGTGEVNRLLQQRLNPDGEAIGNSGLRVGDKVMQVRNNYALETFNGDTGCIDAWDAQEGKVVVRFDERTVVYSRQEAAELTLAYACTVHKSQGSEYPVLVFVVHTQHHIMLQRNLLYTAVTRAQRQVVLVGQLRALAIGVRQQRRQKRHTHLAERLRQACPRLVETGSPGDSVISGAASERQTRRP